MRFPYDLHQRFDGRLAADVYRVQISVRHLGGAGSV